MTTCPTCGSPTDTPALAFLHERVHPFDGDPSDWQRLGELVQAYADQCLAAKQSALSPVEDGQTDQDGRLIDNSSDPRREGVQARANIIGERELAAIQQLHREEREEAQKWMKEKDEALAAERERVRGVLKDLLWDAPEYYEEIKYRLGIDLDK